MLLEVMQQAHPEIIAGWAATKIIDNGFASSNWPLVGEIQTALEEYRDRHSNDETTLRAALANVQERLAYVLESRKDEILLQIEYDETNLKLMRRTAGELNAEVDRLLGREE